MNLPFEKKEYFTVDYQADQDLEVRPFSDLHLEFDDSFVIPNLKPNQVVILAGDIHIKNKAIPWIKAILEQGNHVVYVDGNHEFYRNVMYKVKRAFRALDEEYENFHYLDDSSVFINNVEFLGGTLWTDMNNSNPHVYLPLGEKRFDRYSDNGLWDYRLIYVERPNQGRNGQDVFNVLKTKDTVRFHKKTVQYLKQRAGKHPVQFVVTHHAPHRVFLNRKRNKISLQDYGYYSELHYLAKQFSYWVSGHTHKNVLEEIDGVLYISNQRGYMDDKNPDEHLVHDFNPNLVVKVQTRTH